MVLILIFFLSEILYSLEKSVQKVNWNILNTYSLLVFQCLFRMKCTVFKRACAHTHLYIYRGFLNYWNKAATSQIFSIDFIPFLFSDYCWEIVNILIISSCRAASTDIPDPLSPLLPFVHRFWPVLRATSRILTELLYVGSS